MAIETDWLPPVGQKWREYERKALQIRQFAGIEVFERLDPFALAQTLKLRVISPSMIEGLSENARERLTGATDWSGGVTNLLADGTRLVVINDRQSRGRQAATLMEEICHTLLGHEPSTIYGHGHGRSYHKDIEDEAYGVGAAALAPYRALDQFLRNKQTVNTIARHFGVTRSLVEYRMRILALWKITPIT